MEFGEYGGTNVSVVAYEVFYAVEVAAPGFGG